MFTHSKYFGEPEIPRVVDRKHVCATLTTNYADRDAEVVDIAIPKLICQDGICENLDLRRATFSMKFIIDE